MSFHGQRIIPAINNMKNFEKMLDSRYEYGVFLDMHISALKSVFSLAKKHHKKMFLHADLIQGLKNDEYGAEFLCQQIKPYGLISTRSSAVLKAKQNGILAIQRVFIIDSNALKRSISLVDKTKPDYIEILPGLIPKIIKQMKEKTGKEVFAGGLIETAEEVMNALESGACAVTTSNTSLWEEFQT